MNYIKEPVKSKLLDSIGRRNRLLRDKICECCGKKFRPKNSRVRTCSIKCGFAIRTNGALKLRKLESWWINGKGYIEGRVWLSDTIQRRVKQHRWVMEKELGRKLLPTESVHHINEIKTDNRPDNLCVMLHSTHTTLTNNCRIYKKGYTLILSKEERKRRSELLKLIKMRRNN